MFRQGYMFFISTPLLPARRVGVGYVSWNCTAAKWDEAVYCDRLCDGMLHPSTQTFRFYDIGQ
jgi:hypothetical protein